MYTRKQPTGFVEYPKLHRHIEPSNDERDRGYNAGLRRAIRTVKEYVDCYEKKHNVKCDG